MVGAAVAEAVWTEYGAFLKSFATTLTPPPAVASLAASLTLCLAHKVLGQEATHKEAASGLLHYFLMHEGVNTGSVLRENLHKKTLMYYIICHLASFYTQFINMSIPCT